MILKRKTSRIFKFYLVFVESDGRCHFNLLEPTQNSDLTLLTVSEKFKFDISWYCLNESLMPSQDYIYDTFMVPHKFF